MNIDTDEHPAPDSLVLPVEPYRVEGYAFGHRVRSRIILWARHLGDDVLLDPGTPVHAIGAGDVVWSELRAGSPDARNWGGVVVTAHRHIETGQRFYAIYGHIGDRAVQRGDTVERGQQIGVIAAGNTPENGYWKLAHLHFGLYVGPWMNQILPGYAKPFEGRTKFKWWRNPKEFIEQYPENA